MIIIADSSCLISLSNIHRLELLKQVFGSVTITVQVLEEYGLPVPEWIAVTQTKQLSLFNTLKKILDEGEASSIALATEYPDSLLIIDESDGRKEAQKHSIQIIGTLGVIGVAKQIGVIDKVKTIVEELKKADFRISEQLEKDFLKQNSEL